MGECSRYRGNIWRGLERKERSNVWTNRHDVRLCRRRRVGIRRVGAEIRTRSDGTGGLRANTIPNLGACRTMASRTGHGNIACDAQRLP